MARAVVAEHRAPLDLARGGDADDAKLFGEMSARHGTGKDTCPLRGFPAIVRRMPEPSRPNEVKAELYALGSDVLFGAGLLGAMLAGSLPWIAVAVAAFVPGVGLKVASIRLKSDLTPSQKKAFIVGYVVLGTIAAALVCIVAGVFASKH